MNKQKERLNFKAAFTMVELLVVIAIMVDLAALLFALTSSMKKASSAISVSNLRQIGTAILTSASDNNSVLPGPVLTNHSPRYQNHSISGQLGWFLKDCLTSVSQPENSMPGTLYTSGLDSPVATSDANNPNSKWKPTCVVFSEQTAAIADATFWPMGNYKPNRSGNKTSSITATQLAASEFRGLPWITKTDEVIRPWISRYGAQKEPPHGNYRNSLMFDFSVKVVPPGEIGRS